MSALTIERDLTVADPASTPALRGTIPVPVRETSMRETSVRETPVRDTPVRKAPVREAPGREAPVRETPARPGRRSGRGAAPQARPARAIPAPSLREVGPAHARSCSVAPAPRVQAPGYRITDRGIAAVLIVTAMIAVAAITVIGLTAARVTGPDFRATGSVSAHL